MEEEEERRKKKEEERKEGKGEAPLCPPATQDRAVPLLPDTGFLLFMSATHFSLKQVKRGPFVPRHAWGTEEGQAGHSELSLRMIYSSGYKHRY